ncbi:MAG: hypothetical protein AAF125_19080, partial [Chloroflexota bacterium]
MAKVYRQLAGGAIMRRMTGQAAVRKATHMALGRTARRIAPILLLVLVGLGIFRELAFTDRILGRGDTFVYFYPYWTARDAAFQSGELPLWTPDLFMGAPLLANPQLGTLYPPNWLTIGLAAPDAVRVSILLHIGWAILGAYILARHGLRLSAAGAVVGAALYGLGGYVGAHVEQINQLQGLAWTPWAFWLIGRVVQMSVMDDETSTGTQPAVSLRTRALNVVLLGAVFALQFLAGHTQTVFVTVVGITVWLIAANRPRGLLALGGAGIVALVLA